MISQIFIIYKKKTQPLAESFFLKFRGNENNIINLSCWFAFFLIDNHFSVEKRNFRQNDSL